MVLVTGGAGLVGSELIKQLLKKGERVRAIVNKTPLAHAKSCNLEIVKCSILDVCGLENAMSDIDCIYHCAALIAFTRDRKYDLQKVNVEGTGNIVNAAISARIRKLVHVSSVAALGRPIIEAGLISEEIWFDTSRQQSLYGLSKHLAEMEVWRGTAEGLCAVIINPALVIGPGNWNEGSTAIFKSVYNEFPWYSEGITGYVDVRDVAKAMILLMESDIRDERFILTAENARFRDVFYQIADCFEKKRPSKKVTASIAAMVWRLEAIKSFVTRKPPLVTRETAATALAIQQFDNSKLKSFFPDFQYLELKDSISYTCRALQQLLNKQ